jgi:hypothetical protein
VEVRVFCKGCGEAIEGQLRGALFHEDVTICELCLEAALDMIDAKRKQQAEEDD